MIYIYIYRFERTSMKSIIVVHKSIIFQTGNNHGFPFVLFVYQRDPRFIPVQSSFSTSRARTQRWNRVVSFYTLLRKTRHDFPWCHVRDCFILFRIRLNMFKLYFLFNSMWICLKTSYPFLPWLFSRHLFLAAWYHQSVWPLPSHRRTGIWKNVQSD